MTQQDCFNKELSLLANRLALSQLGFSFVLSDDELAVIEHLSDGKEHDDEPKIKDDYLDVANALDDVGLVKARITKDHGDKLTSKGRMFWRLYQDKLKELSESNEFKSESDSPKGSKKTKGSAANKKVIKEDDHYVEYPVFTRSSGVMEENIRAMYRYLVTRGWISSTTPETQFQFLFKGGSNKCAITWMGQDQMGNNKVTSVGVSALYVLFKKLEDEGLIESNFPVGYILEHHFVDKEGHFLKKVSNTQKTSKKAEDVIRTILDFMRQRLGVDDIKSILKDKMQSKADFGELSYRKRHK